MRYFSGYKEQYYTIQKNGHLIFSLVLAELSLPCGKLPEPNMENKSLLTSDRSFIGVVLLYAEINSKCQ
jgi:hypothetical protein